MSVRADPGVSDSSDLKGSGRASAASAGWIATLRGGDPRLLGQTLRFVLAGSTVALVYLLATTLLASVAGLPFELALPIGFCLALIVNFTLQRSFVWGRRERFALPLAHQAGRYLLLAGAQYAIAAASVALLPPVVGLSQEVVYLAVVAVTAIIGFLVLRSRIFHVGGRGPALGDRRVGAVALGDAEHRRRADEADVRDR